MPISEEELVPDLYRLAFMPGAFRCPQCDFRLAKSCIAVASGQIGTREQERESEPCPNDGTMLVHVTYREALAEYDERLKEMLTLLNTPEVEDFDKAVPLEAAHQVERWGSEHDAGKEPEDWFWVLGYLAGKALASVKAGDIDKAKHHCISSAAVLRNWHAHIRSGQSVMRPGISEEKQTQVDEGGGTSQGPVAQ